MGSEVRELEDPGALLDPVLKVGARCSSLTGELSAPIMLRRDVDVMDDMRRMSRDVRDAFFSSDVEEVDCMVSSVMVREGGEGRLPGREVAGRLDPVDDIDILRSWR